VAGDRDVWLLQDFIGTLRLSNGLQQIFKEVGSVWQGSGSFENGSGSSSSDGVVFR
jgi:hypothetical protein